MKPLKKYATYADLREVPENFVAEMFDGELAIAFSGRSNLRYSPTNRQKLP